MEQTANTNHLTSSHSLAHYQGVIKGLVTTCKYHSVKDAGEVMGQLLYYSGTFPKADVITAVPLHQKRQQERGFNQAAVVARSLSSLINIPYMPLLQRIRNTTKQAHISDKNIRLTHLNQAFRYTARTTYQQVLLIDDVCTTGATLNECAGVLRAAGCQQVHGLTIAHGQ